MFQSVSGHNSEKSIAHQCETNLRITNHRGHKFPPSLILLSFKIRIKWRPVLTTTASFRVYSYSFNPSNIQGNLFIYLLTIYSIQYKYKKEIEITKQTKSCGEGDSQKRKSTILGMSPLFGPQGCSDDKH